VLPVVHLFVFDTLSDWEIGYATTQLSSPMFAPARFTLRTVATNLTPVVTAGGLTVVPDMKLSELRPADSAMLILPGGGRWDSGGNADAVALASYMLEAGVPVAAICGATVGLANNGLLDARRHTSDSPAYLAATGYAGQHLYQDEPVVIDQDLITAGAMAPLEFAQCILARLEVYPPALLAAWYGLFATKDPAYFDVAMAEMAAGGSR
jgi:putative intracellular protease/amidase